MLTISYSPSAYQEDLGSISSQIQTLQEQSLSMNIKLKNRQVSKKHLFIDFLLHESSEACSHKGNLLSVRGFFAALQGHIHSKDGLVDKQEVKMVGYWPSSLFLCLWTKTK